MEIQIISDLHLEYPHNEDYLNNNQIVSSSDVLIIAGDSSGAVKRDVFLNQLNNFKKDCGLIIEISGNHDYYDSDVNSIHPFHDIKDNHHFVERHTIIHNDVRFICTTLWVSPIKEDVNDFNFIHGFTLDECKRINLDCKDWLRTELEKDFDGKTVVVTHHLPSTECVHADWKGHYAESCFVSNLDYLMKEFADTIDLWVFGHGHNCSNKIVNGIHCINNSFGNVKLLEHLDFKEVIVEL